MKKLIILFASITTVLSYAQDSVSVLFIGNSYTYVNDLPTEFSNLTTSMGDEVTFDSKTNGGFTFQNHLVDPLTHSKIQSKPWDFVVIQGQSQEPSFSTAQVNSSTLPPAVSLADSVYNNRYCSQTLYFMTWGRQVGDPQWDSINTFDKMNGRLRNAYVRISDSAQASVAPVGIAWKYVRDNYPTINLYSGDGSHPSVAGTYLAACTFYSSVFRKSPVGASYISTLDAITAEILQNAAAISVLDSLGIWHLRANDEVSIADFHFEMNGGTIQFMNDSWRSTNFEWSFGDGGNSNLENPSYTYAANGTYTVQLIASSECGEDTVTYSILIDALGVQEASKNSILKRSLGNGIYELKGFESLKNCVILMVDATGRRIELNEGIDIDDFSNTITIDLQPLEFGLYLLKVTTIDGEMVFDLPKFE